MRACRSRASPPGSGQLRDATLTHVVRTGWLCTQPPRLPRAARRRCAWLSEQTSRTLVRAGCHIDYPGLESPTLTTPFRHRAYDRLRPPHVSFASRLCYGSVRCDQMELSGVTDRPFLPGCQLRMEGQCP